jgi:endonuclease/exonuclease/phosphatase family metal-dependent hydrolase
MKTVVFIFILASSAQAKDTIKILSYNVFGMPKYITLTNSPKRMEEISKKVNEYDIIGFQEIWINKYYNTLKSASNHKYKFYHNEPYDEFYWYKIGGAGLATFTDLNVIGFKNDYFRSCWGYLNNCLDCLATKGFTILRIELGGALVDVYNVHLEAGSTFQDTKVIEKQIDTLIKTINTISKGMPVIFIGDTNLNPGYLYRELLFDTLLKETKLMDTCKGKNCVYNIDKILIRGTSELSFEVVAWEKQEWIGSDGELSDHRPMYVELKYYPNS